MILNNGPQIIKHLTIKPQQLYVLTTQFDALTILHGFA
jgi:hypothetical protein